MAQTGYTPILIYSSSTAAQAPAAGNLTNSTLGSELAINITDGKLFYKDNANAVQVIGWKTVPTSAGGTGLTSYTAGDLIYYASGTAFTKLAIGATGRWLGSSGTAPQWNAPAALTKVDDTNVTLTLGGSASTALLNAASLTLGWTGQLAVTRGGTGLSTVAQGDILYGSAANTLSALAKNTTATRYLANTGTSNNPAWAQVNLANGVTGTLPIANGGTNVTSWTNNGVVYANASGALTNGTGLVFDGASLGVNTTTSANYNLNVVGPSGQNAAILIRSNGGVTSGKALILDSVNDAQANYPGLQFNTGGTKRGQIIQESTGNIYFDANADLYLRPTGSLISDRVYSVTVGATNRDVYVDNTGVLGYVSSVRESKAEIYDLSDTDWLYALNPVSFKYRKKDDAGKYTDETDGDIQYGMIAEDVEFVRRDLCFYDVVDGANVLRGIQYSKLIPVLVKEVQNLRRQINELKAK